MTLSTDELIGLIFVSHVIFQEFSCVTFVFQGSLKKSGNNYQATKSVGYLLKALMAFQAACRSACVYLLI